MYKPDIYMKLDFDIPTQEIERRKENVRRVWNYEEVDHIPIWFDLGFNPWGYTVRDELTDKEKQLRLRLYSIQQSLELIPDDYIPSVFINIGCVGVDNAFGLPVHWSDNPDQTPYAKGPLIGNPEDVYNIQKPDIHRDGMFPQFLDFLTYFLKELDEQVYVSGLDNNGILGVAHDILGADNFYLTMVDDPQKIDHLAGLITETIIEFTEEVIRLAGDINRLASSDWFYFWCPEGKKGHVSSDTSANYQTDFFNRFDVPFNNKVVRKFGPGLLHNCGPNPCGPDYLNHDPPLSGVNLAYRYSKDDFPALKEPYRHKGVIYIIYDNETPEEALHTYGEVMEILAPDVIAMPIVFIPDESTDVPRLYEQFLSISKEYARRIWR